MRTNQIIGIGVAVLGLTQGAVRSQGQQDTDRKVVGGGVTVPGWKGTKADVTGPDASHSIPAIGRLFS